MPWLVSRGRGRWPCDVVSVGDPALGARQRIAVALTGNMDVRKRHFSVDADWWRRHSLKPLPGAGA